MKVMYIKVASVQYNHYKSFWDQQHRWRMKAVQVVSLASIAV